MSFNLTSLFGIRKKIINVAEEHQQKYNLQVTKGKNRYDKKVIFLFLRFWCQIWFSYGICLKDMVRRLLTSKYKQTSVHENTHIQIQTNISSNQNSF